MKKYILNPKLTDDEIQRKIEKYNESCVDCDDEIDIAYYEDLDAEDGSYTDQMYMASCEYFDINFGDNIDRNHSFEISNWHFPIEVMFLRGEEVERLISIGLLRKNEVDKYNNNVEIERANLLKPYFDINLIVVEEIKE